MPLLLLLEDTPADLRKAADVARRAGYELEVNGFASDARLYLEKAMTGKVPMPDAILIDFDVNGESGFELLRYWHSNPRLKAIRLIVWAHPDPRQRELCTLFGVYQCVYKDDDPNVLIGTLSGIAEGLHRTTEWRDKRAAIYSF